MDRSIPSSSIPSSLLRDHHLMHQMTTRLQRFIDESSSSPDIDVLADLARFFRIFADTHYAAKVTDFFLPFLVRSSASLDPAFVASVRDAQQLQRYYIESMEQFVGAQAAHDLDSWTALRGQVEELIASNTFVASALETAAFPLLDTLNPPERAELEADLEQFDRSSLTNTDRPEVERIAERLIPARRAAGS